MTPAAPVPLSAIHEVDAFSCGVESLDLWLKRHSLKNQIKEQLGPLFLKRRVERRNGQYELRESPAPFDNTGNTFPWHSNDTAHVSTFS